MLGKGWEVIHNPEDSSHSRVIHGHIHLPYAKRVIKQKNGRLFINVNCELWDYTPVSIKQINKEIENELERI
jgi:calcineurin-like phosphoesterase family protein